MKPDDDARDWKLKYCTPVQLFASSCTCDQRHVGSAVWWWYSKPVHRYTDTVQIARSWSPSTTMEFQTCWRNQNSIVI